MDHIGKTCFEKKNSHYYFLLRCSLKFNLIWIVHKDPDMFIFITLPSKQSPHNPCLSNNPPVIPNTLQAKASGAVLDGFFHTISHLYRFTRNLEHIPYFKHVGMQHIYIMNSNSSSSNLHLPPTFWNTFGKEFQYTQSTHHFWRVLPSSQTNPNPNFCLEKVRGHYIRNKHGTNGREHSSRLP